VDVRELWRFRELLGFLVWRDVKVRYKQTAVGAVWAVLQPVGVMAVLSFALRRVAGDTGSAIPYWLFVLSGLVPWTLFAATLTQTGQSVIGNHQLVTKVYFPRLLLPLAAAGVAVVDFLVGLALVVVAALAVGVVPGPGVLAAPLAVGAVLLNAVGLGLLVAAVTVVYRDFRVVLPLLVQMWMFLTPAIYLQAAGGFGTAGNLALAANPVQGAVVNFRAALLGTPFDWAGLALSWATGAALFAAGTLYFRRAERSFSDSI
jgi:lipopolysaccharide transport system permease protein